MCYYSTAIASYERRDAVEGEHLRVSTYSQHHVAKGADGKVVCMKHGSEVHIQNFQLNPAFRHCMPYLWELEGKDVTGRFAMTNESLGYSADRFELKVGSDPTATYHVHIAHLKVGTEFYTGPRQYNIGTLGVDDPSIVHDHKVESDPVLSMQHRTFDGMCSIQR